MGFIIRISFLNLELSMENVKLGFPQQLHKELALCLFVFCNLGNRFSFVLLMLLVCGDIELKPG